MRSPGPPSYAALGDTAAYEHRAVTFDRRVPRNAPLSYCDAARSWCVLCGNRRSDCPGFDKNSAHPKYEPLAFLPAATDDATVMDFIEKTGGGLASSPRADHFKTLKALQRRSSDSRSGGRGGGNGDGGGWRGSDGSRAPSGGFHRGVGGLVAADGARGLAAAGGTTAAGTAQAAAAGVSAAAAIGLEASAMAAADHQTAFRQTAVKGAAAWMGAETAAGEAAGTAPISSGARGGSS